MSSCLKRVTNVSNVTCTVLAPATGGNGGTNREKLRPIKMQRSCSNRLPRHTQRDDDQLASSSSFPALPSLSLSLKGSTHGLASTHVHVPRTLQTVSHYEQLHQLQEAARDRVRSETTGLSKQLALALARAERAEAQLREMPAPDLPKRQVLLKIGDRTVAALRGEVETLQSEAVALRRQLVLEKQRAS